MHERVQLCQDPQTEFTLLREYLGVSRINHILRVHGFTILPKSLVKLGTGHLRDSFQDLQKTFSNKPRSVLASEELGTRERGTLPAKHTSVHSLQPNQDAATAGLIPKQPLLARLDASIEAATAVYLDALDDSQKPTTTLYLQKAAQAADESWQQTVQGHIQQCQKLNRLAHRMTMTTPNPRLLHPVKSRRSAPQLQAQLSRWSDRTRLRRL